MPTGEHELSIALARLDPGLPAWLLVHLFDVRVPDYHHARARPADERVLVQGTYHANGVVLYYDAADQPVFAVMLEVQRGWDSDKWRMWKLRVAELAAELTVHVALVVYCPDPAIAGWYRDMLEHEKLTLRLRPFIFTPHEVPLVIDVELARANPALAVFSVICHAGEADVDAAFPAIAEALRALGPKKAIAYNDILLAGLPQAPRARWEAYMSAAIDPADHSGITA